MTTQPLRHPHTRTRLEVVKGSRSRRPSVAPWVVFSLVAVVAFLGMVLTRTALDRSAIELARVERQIVEAKTTNQILRLEIGRLESPARIAPLAAEMGMVYPRTSEKLMVAGVIPDQSNDPRWAELDRLAVAAENSGGSESQNLSPLAAGAVESTSDWDTTP